MKTHNKEEKMKKVLSILLCLATLIGSFSVCSVSANADSSLSSGDISTENFDSLLIPNQIVLLTRTRPKITQYIGSDYCEAYGLLLSDIEIFPDMEADVVTDFMRLVDEKIDEILITLTLANPLDMEYALETLMKNPEIISLQQNYYVYPETIVYPEATDYDPVANQQWALDVIGVQDAWEMGFIGSSNVTVAVIDTGIDTQHPDLELNIDMVNSWNLAEINDDIDDNNGHGTAMAGVIGADYDDYGINGVCQNINILSIKIEDDNNISTFGNLQQGVIAAIVRDADVINISSTIVAHFSYNHPKENNYYDNYDGLIITSAGNDGALMSSCESAAGKVNAPETFIVVGASGASDNSWENSNYDPEHVDLFAPGKDIYSTHINSTGYILASGSSFSAAYVSAACALIMSHAPHLTGQEVKSLILNNVELFDSLTGLCSTGGRLAIDNAIIALYNQSRPAYSKGDLNGDGSITTVDYALAKRIVLNTYTPTETEASAADINGNGTVDATDYALIQRYYNKTFYFSPF